MEVKQMIKTLICEFHHLVTLIMNISKALRDGKKFYYTILLFSSEQEKIIY